MTVLPNTDLTLSVVCDQDCEAVTRLVTFVHKEYAYDMDWEGRDTDLQQLSTVYSPPKSRFWVLKTSDGEVVGCGAIKQLDDETAELCRFYFYPAYRSKGTGSHLLEVLIDFARNADYQRVVLETHTDMVEAVQFYRKHQWREIPPYAGNPWEYSNIAFEYTL